MSTNLSNTEMEIITPHPSNYVRSINNTLTKQLKAEDTGMLQVPTLLERAKALVTKKRFIILYTTKAS